VAAYPDDERKQEFLARAKAHWDARVQFLWAGGAKAAPSTRLAAHFEWLVRYQVGRESAYHIAKRYNLSGARAVLPRIRNLANLIDLPLRKTAR
jgi:hypothetical protein